MRDNPICGPVRAPLRRGDRTESGEHGRSGGTVEMHESALLQRWSTDRIEEASCCIAAPAKSSDLGAVRGLFNQIFL